VTGLEESLGINRGVLQAVVEINVHILLGEGTLDYGV